MFQFLETRIETITEETNVHFTSQSCALSCDDYYSGVIMNQSVNQDFGYRGGGYLQALHLHQTFVLQFLGKASFGLLSYSQNTLLYFCTGLYILERAHGTLALFGD